MEQHSGTATTESVTVDKATPRPWRVGDALDEGYALVILAGEPRRPHDDLDRIVCCLKFVKRPDEVEANAEYIVHCVNNFEAVVAAAKAALKYVDDLNEDTPVDPNCKECVGTVFYTKGTEPPPLCWIHQLKEVVKP